jgi:hypothetical protein
MNSNLRYYDQIIMSRKIESLNDNLIQPDTILSFLNEHFHHFFYHILKIYF